VLLDSTIITCFTETKKRGEVKLCQSGVGGGYGPPEDIDSGKYDVFKMNHMTFSQNDWDREAFIRGEKEIVIASKYKNNIIETTSFEKLIYEEKIVFYSKNTELLKIIEQNLNNKEINSFWQGMKQNIILSLVDFPMVK